MSRREILRFGVRDADDRAATWCVVKPNIARGDVYLACRELDGTLHFSMHESDEWHVGYEKTKLAELFEVPGGFQDHYPNGRGERE